MGGAGPAIGRVEAALRGASAAVVALAVGWVLGALGLLAGGAPVRTVPEGALTLCALALGGHVRFAGAVVSDPHGAELSGWPLTVTVVVAVTLGWRLLRAASPARAAGTPSGSGTGTGPWCGLGAVAALSGLGVLAAWVGASGGGDGMAGTTRFSAPLLPTLLGAVVVGAVVVGAVMVGAVGLIGAAPAVEPVPADEPAGRAARAGPLVPVRAWMSAWLSGPLVVVGVLLLVALVAALLLVGYATGDGGRGRLVALSLAAPNLAALLVLVAFGVPVEVRSSTGGLLADVPLLGHHVTYAGGDRATLSLQHLLDVHAGYLAMPVLAALALLGPATWLALRHEARGRSGPGPPGSAAGLLRPSPERDAALLGAALGAVLAAVCVTMAALTAVDVDLRGGGALEPLTGSAHASYPLAAGLGALWGVLAGVAGAVAARGLPPDARTAARRRLRLPEPPPRPPGAGHSDDASAAAGASGSGPDALGSDQP